MGDNVNRLAHAFATALRATLSPTEMADVLQRNASGEYDGACASHDFCDANLVMADAFRDVMGRDILRDDGPPTDADCTLWNAAWTKAHLEGFPIAETQT